MLASWVPEVRTVDLLGDVRLQYVERGNPSGIPVVFLHGFADSWRSFEPVLAFLPDRIHAYSLTQRGHGDAGRPASGYGIHHFAADLAAFMDAAHLGGAVIVGHSMGSAVALRFAIDHPQRTSALVLVGASPTIAPTPAARAFWDSAISELMDPVDPTLIRQMTEGMLVRHVPPPFLDSAVHESTKVPAFVWRAVFESRWSREGDYATELGRIGAPTLIVWGEEDARYSRAEQEVLLSEIRGSRLIAYPGAGHLLHWEQPERFASDLVAFIQGIE